jgi:hypothetical protein
MQARFVPTLTTPVLFPHSHDCQATVAAIGFLTANTRLYSARPILLSGTCKTEDGKKHAELLQLLIRVINAQLDLAVQAGSHRCHIVSVASDGETRRGRALAMLTMNSKLAPSSKIYDQLSNLRFMNLLVGEDEITADKDYKHIFKRLRCKQIRASGIAIIDQVITASSMRLHLMDAGESILTIDPLFRPNDKQDVVLAYSLLQKVIKLPPPPSDKSPGYKAMREALSILGQVFKYVLHPFICIDFTLSEQLEYLSAAAHLLLILYRLHGKKFFPTLLYTDIMIMIKNIYFCVAKAKVLTPLGRFFIILLGTDRLEILFGIIRSMIGNDNGVDLLQLGDRVTGTTEVADIFGQHPEWDRSPRRLRLPLIDRDGNLITLSNAADHVSPGTWNGDVTLAFVNLQTSWQRGLSLLEENPYLTKICAYLQELKATQDSAIDILSPLGTLLIKHDAQDDDSDDDDNDDDEIEGTRFAILSHENGARMDGAGFVQEVEDTVGEAEAEDALLTQSRPSFLPYVMVNGEKINKARLLSRLLQNKKTTASSDRLKRYQDISRFNTFTATPASRSSFTSESQDDELYLIIGDPIVSLLQCENKPFLSFGEVLDISLDSEVVDRIPITMLSSLTVAITYQLIHLFPTTTADDPSQNHDWRSRHSPTLDTVQNTVPGQLIQTINPTLSEPFSNDDITPHRPFYLLDSDTLIALTASFLNHLGSEDAKRIPTAARTSAYPYRKAGKNINFSTSCTHL